MSDRIICPCKGLHGEIMIPGDKSISHRSIMLGALALGTTEITNFLEGADCLSTIGCFQSMGIQIDRTPEKIIVHGKGMHGLAAPKDILNVGEQWHNNSPDVWYFVCPGLYKRDVR